MALNGLSRTGRRLGPLLVALSILPGCVDLSGHGPARLWATLRPRQTVAALRPGHAYCMRGFLGIFSTGIDQLARQLRRDDGIPAASCADSEPHRLYRFLLREYRAGRLRGPLVLIGHSWGADDQIRVARRLGRHGISVRLLVAIDPVTPPEIPPNVERCIDIYKSHPLTDFLPFWRGVPARAKNPRRTKLTNINLRYANVGFPTAGINHINIEKNPGVHRMILALVQRCIPVYADLPPRASCGGRFPARQAYAEHASSLKLSAIPEAKK